MCCLMVVVRFVFWVVSCSMLVAWCLLVVDYCLVWVVRCALRVACCSLVVFGCCALGVRWRLLCWPSLSDLLFVFRCRLLCVVCGVLFAVC